MRTPSPHARRLRRTMTDAERVLWKHLRDRRLGGHKFRRQYTIGPFVADFACIEARLIVEADGSQHVDSDSDAKRTAYMERKGWRVLRFWNNDILRHRSGVLEAILAACNSSPAAREKGLHTNAPAP